MNKFDITELPKQWLVALVALAFTFLLVVPGCAGEAADNGGNGENAAEQAAQVAEEEGPIEAPSRPARRRRTSLFPSPSRCRKAPAPSPRPSR